MRSLICIACILIGVILANFSLRESRNILSDSNHINSDYRIIDDAVNKHNNNSKWNIFAKILISNITVAFFLSVVGFFTAGFITCVTLIVNGFNVTILLLRYIELGNSAYDTFNLMVFHGVTEVIAFIWFGSIGLLGFSFYRNIIKNGYHKKTIPSPQKLVAPSILLLFSALTEIVYGVLKGFV